MDYGIRVSFTGKDVKTCDDIDCVLTSKYSNLKGSLSGSGSVTCPSGVTQTITVNHGLGYIPMARVLHNFTGSVYEKAPYINGNVNFDIQIFPRLDSTTLKIEFTYNDYIGGGSSTFSYKYFIFIDKGNLN